MDRPFHERRQRSPSRSDEHQQQHHYSTHNSRSDGEERRGMSDYLSNTEHYRSSHTSYHSNSNSNNNNNTVSSSDNHNHNNSNSNNSNGYTPTSNSNMNYGYRTRRVSSTNNASSPPSSSSLHNVYHNYNYQQHNDHNDHNRYESGQDTHYYRDQHRIPLHRRRHERNTSPPPPPPLTSSSSSHNMDRRRYTSNYQSQQPYPYSYQHRRRGGRGGGGGGGNRGRYTYRPRSRSLSRSTRSRSRSRTRSRSRSRSHSRTRSRSRSSSGRSNQSRSSSYDRRSPHSPLDRTRYYSSDTRHVHRSRPYSRSRSRSPSPSRTRSHSRSRSRSRSPNRSRHTDRFTSNSYSYRSNPSNSFHRYNNSSQYSSTLSGAAHHRHHRPPPHHNQHHHNQHHNHHQHHHNNHYYEQTYRSHPSSYSRGNGRYRRFYGAQRHYQQQQQPSSPTSPVSPRYRSSEPSTSHTRYYDTSRASDHHRSYREIDRLEESEGPSIDYYRTRSETMNRSRNDTYEHDHYQQPQHQHQHHNGNRSHDHYYSEERTRRLESNEDYESRGFVDYAPISRADDQYYHSMPRRRDDMVDDMEREESRLRDRGDQGRDTTEWNGTASSPPSPASDYHRSNVYRENWSRNLDNEYNYTQQVAAPPTTTATATTVAENTDTIPYNDDTESLQRTTTTTTTATTATVATAIEQKSKNDYTSMETPLADVSNSSMIRDDKTNTTMTTSTSISSSMYKINYGSGLELYERLGQVGEGTYGKVYKARNRETGQLVALKRIRMETERDGFPITAIREMKLLQSMCHDNVVKLYEVMILKGSVYLVFEYMDYDLAGVQAHPMIRWHDTHIKCLLQQLLRGLDYLHKKGILHRDIKGSNLLLSRKGELKLTDFGLARWYRPNQAIDYTNRVVTLWYRPPELLLGETKYGPEIDLWGAGCILLELLTGKPPFQGHDEISQLEQIYQVMGVPNTQEWPKVVDLPWYHLIRPKEAYTSTFHERYANVLSPSTFSLAEQLLAMNPVKRPTAQEALEHAYFKETPLPCSPDELPKMEGDWHEFESKQRQKKRHASGVVSTTTTLSSQDGHVVNNNSNGNGNSGTHKRPLDTTVTLFEEEPDAKRITLSSVTSP